MGMKKIFYFFLLSSILSFGQSADSLYAEVDSRVANYPKSFSSVKAFAERIQSDYKIPELQARAAFTWISKNVAYDLNLMRTVKQKAPASFSFRTEAEKLQKQRERITADAVQTLKSKKGVCQGYSSLFYEVCDQLGIPAKMIPGASKSMLTHIGKLPEDEDHVWNKIYINDKWELVDVTWAAGIITGEKPKFEFRFNPAYFCTPAELFAFTHFATAEAERETGMTAQEFADLPLYYGSYLLANFDLETPITAFLKPRANDILLRLNFLSENAKVGLRYSMGNEFIPLELTYFDDYATATLPQTPTGGYATLYINGRSVVSWRIKN